MLLEDDIKIVHNKVISMDGVNEWIEDFEVTYLFGEHPQQCNKIISVCFCTIRNKYCLQAELYNKLTEIAKIHELNKIFQKELIKYEFIKDNAIELRVWLNSHVEIGLSEMFYFMEPTNRDIKMRFNLGEIDGEKTDLTFKIKGTDFKYVYKFAKLFSKLFFKERILPEEYQKWKTESGYIEM